MKIKYISGVIKHVGNQYSALVERNKKWTSSSAIKVKGKKVGRDHNLRNISYCRDIYGIDPKVLAQAQKETL